MRGQITGGIQRPSTTWRGRPPLDTEYSVIDRGTRQISRQCIRTGLINGFGTDGFSVRVRTQFSHVRWDKIRIICREAAEEYSPRRKPWDKIRIIRREAAKEYSPRRKPWVQVGNEQAPEGRTNLAQRFSAGKSGRNNSSPGGTAQFSRTHFSGRV